MTQESTFKRFFDPTAKSQMALPDFSGRVGDRTKKSVYVYDEHDDIVLAVNVALATSRPLLVSGDPGTGKTSLAAHVAKTLKWRFYKLAISHRTQARDLLWTFDTVGRLSDAQTQKGAGPKVAYVNPGVLWWAFDKPSAERRGLTETRRKALQVLEAKDPAEGVKSAERAVVLLDEIDKADPDVPNNLLEALGSFRFSVDGVDEVKEPVVAAQPPLVLLTTNDERELPRAFLRRCVSLTLQAPKDSRLYRIARTHFPKAKKKLFEEVAQQLDAIRKESTLAGRPQPSTAEYLDAVGACLELGVLPGTEAWTAHWPRIAEATLRKERKLPGATG